jgi:hypothetical protein
MWWTTKELGLNFWQAKTLRLSLRLTQPLSYGARSFSPRSKVAQIGS